MPNAADLVAQAIVKLQEARDLLKQAGAVKTVPKVRLAIASAKGAQRNVDARPYRERVRAAGKLP